MCYTCATSNRPCSYTTPPKKRGIQPGYIRTLELTIAWIFENVSGSESALKSALAQESISSVLSGKDAEGSYRLHKTWRKSTSCKDLEKLLGKAEHTPTPGSPDRQAHHENAESTVFGISPIVETDASLIAKLPSNLWRLLDVYYAYTHTWFPIIQKHDMLKLAYSYGEQELKLCPGEATEHAELWALLAVASVQDEAVGSGPTSDQSSREIYNNARKLIPDERGKLSLSHVKALLLLTLIKVGSERWSEAWLLLGNAINVAVDLGAQTPRQPDFERSQHVVLACCMLENLLCVHMGRVPRLSSLDVGPLGLLEEDGLEEWHPWTPCDGFNQDQGKDSVVSLSRAPNHSLSIFNQLFMLSNGIRGTSAEAIDISLPSSLRLIDPRASTPQLLHLHMAQACSMGATMQAQQLFSEFTQTFGVVAMPTVFRLHISVLLRRNNSGVDISGYFKDALSALSSVWRTGTDDTDTSVPEPGTISPDDPLNFMTMPNFPEASPIYAESTPMDTRGATMASIVQPVPDMQGSQANESHKLRYNTHHSMDLEALFDELGSLDGTDSADRQPLFMQNLGLASSAEFNDVLASDFGFDPLLSTYMNSMPVNPDQARNFPG